MRKTAFVVSVVLLVTVMVATMILLPRPGVNNHGFYQTENSVRIMLEPCIITDEPDSNCEHEFHLERTVTLENVYLYAPVKAEDLKRDNFRETIDDQEFLGIAEDAFRNSHDTNTVFDEMVAILHPDSRDFDGIVWVPKEAVNLVS